MSDQIVLEKKTDIKSNITYIRLDGDLRSFVDSLAEKLGVKRSEAIRRLIEDAKKKGVLVK
jgi:metal-responsive CopG/Arc/MetJ family transcriptional regulator